MPHHLLEQSFEIKIQNLKLLILAMIGNIDEIRIAQQLLTSLFIEQQSQSKWIPVKVTVRLCLYMS